METKGPFDLTGLTLSRAHLRGDWSRVIFRRASLTEIDLSDCDLTDVDLRDARLVACAFRGAKLTGALLQGALIQNSSDLTALQLASARGDRNTVLPGHLTYPHNWSID